MTQTIAIVSAASLATLCAAAGSYFHEIDELDRRIVEAAVDDAIAQGFEVSVYDGSETTVRQSSDRIAILTALCTTDEDRLYFHRQGVPFYSGWVWLVYGNEPGVVFCDYTDNEATHAILARANKISEEADS